MGANLNPKNRRKSKFRSTRDMSIIVRCAVIVRDGHRCVYCKQSLNTRELEMDHIIGRKDGGQSIATNLVSCCGPCNRDKSNGRIDYRRLFDAIELAQTPISRDAGKALARSCYPSRMKSRAKSQALTAL